jgi:hypothetical protein
MSGASAVSVGVLAIIVAIGLDAARTGGRGDATAFVLLTLGVFSTMSGSGAAASLEASLIDTTAAGLEAATVQASATDARFVASGLVSMLFIGGVLSIIPEGMGGRFAAFASRFTLHPRSGWRLNWKVYVIGIPLGMLVPLADLPGSALALLNWAWVTVWAFGAALGSGA